MSDSENRFISGNTSGRKLIIVIVFFAIVLVFSCAMFLTRISNWNNKDHQYIYKVINSENPVSSDWSPEFEIIDDMQLICSDCSQWLRSMISDCKAAGGSPVLYSCYRSDSAQQAFIDHLAQRFIEAGMTEEEAAARAVGITGEPGCSEHQLGYAVDIISAAFSEPELDMDSDPTMQWLYENSWRYGFILRYTASGTEITGVEYVPWHFRYVGSEAAEQIYTLGITLEEYNKMFFS